MKEKALIAILLLAPLAAGVILGHYMPQELASVIAFILFLHVEKIYENAIRSDFFVKDDMKPFYRIVSKTLEPYKSNAWAKEVLTDARHFCDKMFMQSNMSKEEAEVHQILQENNTYGWRLLAYCFIFSRGLGHALMEDPAVSHAKYAIKLFCAEELCRADVGQCFLDLFDIDKEKLQKYCNKG